MATLTADCESEAYLTLILPSGTVKMKSDPSVILLARAITRNLDDGSGLEIRTEFPLADAQ